MIIDKYYKELEETIDSKVSRNFILLPERGGGKMLTPTKNLHEDKAILKIGARILSFLTFPRTLSSTWEAYTEFQNQESLNIPNIQFDTFILALDFLYMIGAIEYQEDLLRRTKSD